MVLHGSRAEIAFRQAGNDGFLNRRHNMPDEERQPVSLEGDDRHRLIVWGEPACWKRRGSCAQSELW